MPSANVKQSVPFLMVTDMAAALRFYVEGLGFNKTIEWMPHGEIEWCWLQHGGAALMLQEYREGRRPDGTLGLGTSICFMCEDALAIYRDTRGRGLAASQQPFVGNNCWVVEFRDPDGHALYFESETDAPEESILNE
jgi:lactoylglutathione lyase